MKKIFFSLAATFIIIILIAYILYSQFNSNKILENLEQKTELSINLIGKNIWNFFPIISFKNNDVQIVDNQKLFAPRVMVSPTEQFLIIKNYLIALIVL